MVQIFFELSFMGQTYSIPSYILFNIILAIAAFFISGLFFLVREGVPWKRASFSLFLLVLLGLLGARIMHVLGNVSWYLAHDISPFALEATGFTFYGGILFGIPLSLIMGSLFKMRRGRVLDVLSPGLGLALFFNKLGCFFNGCCFGRVTSLPWGVVFPQGTRAYAYYTNHYFEESGELIYYASEHIALHPVQLYESLIGLGLFVLALLLLKRQNIPGIVCLSILYIFSFSRMILYFFRAPGLGTLPQHYSLLGYAAMSLISLFLLYRRRGSYHKIY